MIVTMYCIILNLLFLLSTVTKPAQSYALLSSRRFGFTVIPGRQKQNEQHPSAFAVRTQSTSLNIFDKVFEESGPLGKGITVGKVQIALMSPDRGKNSIFQMLQDNARWIEGDDDANSLADFAHDVCLTLLRKKDLWTAACSAYKWFSMNDDGKAESLYNEWSNTEAAKFEKQYIPDDTTATDGKATIVVVSLVIEIEGDNTKFDGAGFSLSGTQAVLYSIASNCKVDDGEVTRAVEVFWTPSDPTETLTSRDIIVDFPELIDL